MQIRVIALLVAGGAGLGCATTVDRVVAEALRTPWQQATYTPSTGTTMAAALTRLETRVRQLGVRLEYVDLEGRGFGWQEERYIAIEQTLTANGRLEILAHEAGHLFHSPWLTVPERQVFAELVGAEVCGRLGWDMRQTSGRYLGQFKGSLPAGIASRIDRERAVRILLGEEEP